MTEEEKKAIERCKELIKPEHSGWIGITNQETIYIVLNLIQNQQSELEKKDKQINSKKGTINALQNALKERTEERDRKDNVISRQNKIIDKMAEYLASIDFDQHCAEIPDICMRCPKEDNLDGYMQCIKQYFERKVK